MPEGNVGMSEAEIRGVRRVTLLTTGAAIAFYGFFQLGKIGPFRAVNPFGDDPCDAVGSFAVQVALLVGLLTIGRALRLPDGPAQAAKARLVFRGDAVVVVAIFVTLASDALAERVRPLPPSYWGGVLFAVLIGMSVLATACAVAVVVVFRETETVPPPLDLTPAEGIEDLWALARVPVTRVRRILPRALVELVERFSSDRLFAKFPPVNPRTHPWRFACVLGLVAGTALLLAQLQEGLPPTLGVGLAVAVIFVAGELIATLLGFAFLGGFLGLRPPLSRNR